jgi:hypothetical protein
MAGLIAIAVAPAALAASGPRALGPIGGLLPPVAVDDSMTTKHDQTKTVAAPGVLGNDIQIDLLGGYTTVLTTNVTHGTLALHADGGYVYTPTAGYVGADSFKYKINGGLLGLSNIATVSIAVTNVAPVAANDSYTAVTGVTRTIAAPGVLGNDGDGDGDSITATLVDGSGNGSLSLSANGGFTFTSGGSFTGARTFTYRASDGIASSAIATVTIQVSAPAATPTPQPTPTPAPTPTPVPTATPTPAPTATPTPNTGLPLPSVPLPSLPVPSLPIPTLPALPTPTPSIPGLLPTPTPSIPGILPTPTPVPGASGGATGVPAPGAGSTPSPSPGPSSVATASGGPGGAGGTGGGGGAAPGDLFAIPAFDPAGPIDAVIDGTFDGFGGIEWAVPAFALGVPGLLLILAVIAQGLVSIAWLPMIKRWLGGFGLRRRRRTGTQVAS